jgi:sec-independent protein translocase protein TatA
MFGSIGMQELIIIFVIALIIFGPRRLPELGKSLGKSIAEFKRASNDLRNTLEEEIRVDEQRQAKTAATTPASAAANSPAAAIPGFAAADSQAAAIPGFVAADSQAATVAGSAATDGQAASTPAGPDAETTPGDAPIQHG